MLHFCEAAAKLGYFSLLQWGVEKVGFRRGLGRSVQKAAEAGHDTIVRWLVSERKQPVTFGHAVRAARRANQNELAIWLRAQGAGWHREHWQAAVRLNDVALLKTMLSLPHVCQPDDCVVHQAAAFGSLDALRLLRQHCVPMAGQDVWTPAARRGHLSVLQWAAAERIPYAGSCLSSAVLGRHLAVADYLWPTHKYDKSVWHSALLLRSSLTCCCPDREYLQSRQNRYDFCSLARCARLSKSPAVCASSLSCDVESLGLMIGFPDGKVVPGPCEGDSYQRREIGP
jgi:hypothetical protein